MSEIAATKGRTWFGTMTLNGTARTIIKSGAIAEVGPAEYAALRPEERSKLLARHGNKLLTDWLKRVREESGSALRYLLVAEAHKDGIPHWHILLHEGETPVRHKVLSKQWQRNGFCNFKLKEDTETDQAASYVTKYIQKSPLTRVRASVAYGNGDNKNALTPSSHSERGRNVDPPNEEPERSELRKAQF